MEAAITASETRDQFLHLLVTQLRNQDPLDPVKQHDFLAQLAQFSTLEGIEKLNRSFDQQLHVQQQLMKVEQLAQGSNLIGQTVVFERMGEGGLEELVEGVVDAVVIKTGDVVVRIGNDTVSIDRIHEVIIAQSD